MYPLNQEVNLPKGLLPIANKPMLYYALDWLEKSCVSGISAFDSDVIIACYPDARTKISSYVHEVYESNMTILVDDVPEGCGSAEALRHIKAKLKVITS